LLTDSDANVTIPKKACPDLTLFGQVVRNDSEDLKIVSGTIIRTMMENNISADSFFKPEAENIAKAFPTSTDEAWFNDFSEFADKLDEADMVRNSYVEHLL